MAAVFGTSRLLVYRRSVYPIRICIRVVYKRRLNDGWLCAVEHSGKWKDISRATRGAREPNDARAVAGWRINVFPEKIRLRHFDP